MKIIKRESLKTQPSELVQGKKKKSIQQWLEYSHKRNPNTAQTPLRFACITLRNNSRTKNTLSTQDRDKSENKSYRRKMETQIGQTIDFLKEMWKQKSPEENQNIRPITPFVLPFENTFQEQISFKGVSNRQKLCAIIQSTQRQILVILGQIDKLSKRSELNEARAKKQHKIQLFMKQIESFKLHIKQISQQIDDFRVEYIRCEDNIKKLAGISIKCLQFYQNRFQIVLKSMREKVLCLEKISVFTPNIKIQRKKVQKGNKPKLNGR